MNDTKRRPLVGGNWKMHMLRQPAHDFCDALVGGLGSERAEIVLFPSFPLLHVVADALESSAAAVGGQDLHTADQGAHTGDVSGPQLADAGCQWVLCGHSERRADHHETDELVGEKAVAANRHGLYPLICLGETLEERQGGRTFEVLERQLNAGLAGRPEPFALAYEPVWAIGTGETATPEIAQEAHRFLRERLADLLGDEVAQVKRIVYGGSANPENASTLFAEPDIDGFLVGGASLDPEKFLAIIRSCG
jgi:triosephosphate isomerase